MPTSAWPPCGDRLALASGHQPRIEGVVVGVFAVGVVHDGEAAVPIRDHTGHRAPAGDAAAMAQPHRTVPVGRALLLPHLPARRAVGTRPSTLATSPAELWTVTIYRCSSVRRCSRRYPQARLSRRRLRDCKAIKGSAEVKRSQTAGSGTGEVTPQFTPVSGLMARKDATGTPFWSVTRSIPSQSRELAKLDAACAAPVRSTNACATAIILTEKSIRPSAVHVAGTEMS